MCVLFDCALYTYRRMRRVPAINPPRFYSIAMAHTIKEPLLRKKKRTVVWRRADKRHGEKSPN
uniref:Uncharacterized protein n=1 Tax=Anopheles dirus TaxID=7168 RepID=A0A182NW24_9DIPT